MSVGFYFSDHLGWARKGKPQLCPLKALQDSTDTLCWCVKPTKGQNFVLLGCVEAEHILRQFARECALSVIHLWKAPDIVVQYLQTGDENIRGAARDAAWNAARDAARNAAWGTAWNATRDAARDAAWGTAWAAARAAAWGTARDATWDATRAATWDATWDATQEGWKRYSTNLKALILQKLEHNLELNNETGQRNSVHSRV